MDPAYSDSNEKYIRLLDLNIWLKAGGADWEHPEREEDGEGIRKERSWEEGVM